MFRVILSSCVINLKSELILKNTERMNHEIMHVDLCRHSTTYLRVQICESLNNRRQP
jgi:hypothetical protein